MSSDIAVVGLAVMGQNLVLNMNDHGFVVTVFNRTVSKVKEFLHNEAKGTKVVGAYTIEEMCLSLKKPRIIMFMVMAGEAVDAFIEAILPFIEEGDIVIDGGNSHFTDTQRRFEYLNEKNILYVGCGVSGGEEGARHGPSIMPGGNDRAWPYVSTIMKSISAKVKGDSCCSWVGGGGIPEYFTSSGHYVKMIHNGIEYGDMQLICEAYHLMKVSLSMTCDEMSKVFSSWNEGNFHKFIS